MLVGARNTPDFWQAVMTTRAQLAAPVAPLPYDLAALLVTMAQIEALMGLALLTQNAGRMARLMGGGAPRCAPRAFAPPPSGSIPAGRLVQPGFGAPPARPAPPSSVVNASTAGLSEAQKFDHYAKLGAAPSAPGERAVVSIRTPTNTKVNGGGGAYDDTTAVIWQDKDGTKHCVELRSNTEPSAKYEGKYGQDANGDGSLDQGRLRAGTYTYTLSEHNGAPAFRMQGDAAVDRDTNHDGVFGNDGGAATGGGGSMLFHAGGTTSTGSAGCQTMPPAEYERFLAAMGGSAQFTYTLVER